MRAPRVHYGTENGPACGAHFTHDGLTAVGDVGGVTCRRCLACLRRDRGRALAANAAESRAGVAAGDEFWAGTYAERAAHLAFELHPELREMDTRGTVDQRKGDTR